MVMSNVLLGSTPDAKIPFKLAHDWRLVSQPTLLGGESF